MKNRNTMSKSTYIFENVFWTLLLMFWYRKLMFRCLYDCSLVESKIFIWSLVCLLVVISCMFTYKKKRNIVSLISNVVLPFEIYTLFSYWDDMPVFFTIICIITIGLSMLNTFLIFSKRITNKEKYNQIIVFRKKRSVYEAKTIVSCTLLGIIIPFLASAIFGNSLLWNSVEAEKPTIENSWTIKNNMNVMPNLLDENWIKLNSQKKLETLQTVANIEANYLGISHELNVVASTVEEEVIACYIDDEHKVAINIDYLSKDSAEEMLNAICHECYHAYQHRILDAYNTLDDDYKSLLAFYDVSFYEEEFNNYSSGENDFFEYYFQHCEQTAREYAKNSTKEYYDVINKYLSENES